MRILYLIGNGFDLAQGIDTRYSDFYKAKLKGFPVDGSIIGKLQKSITENTKTWADMEKGLGEFTAEMGGIGDLDATFGFLRTNLRDYLKDEQNRLKASAKDISDSRMRLLQPGQGLPPETSDAINNFIANLTRTNKSIEIDIISFNYTDVVERAFGYDGTEIKLGKTGSDIVAMVGHIYKVHGDLDHMVMGVAEESQIANKSLAGNLDATELLMKPKHIEARRDYVWKRCYECVSRADIIVLYGLSIGETDKNWWAKIVERVYSDGNVRVITYGHNDPPFADVAHQRRAERAIYKKLFNAAGKSLLQYGLHDNRVFITFEDSIFQGLIEKKE